MSSDRGMDKEDLVHMYSGILVTGKNETMPLQHTDGSRGYYAKRSKSDRDMQIPYDIAYMWSLKKVIQMIHTEETRFERDMCTPMFIAALFTTAKT